MNAIRLLTLLAAALALPMSAHSQTAKAATKPPAKAVAAAVPMIALAVADAEQLLAAAQAYLGPHDCEFKQLLRVAKHRVEGYLEVNFSNKTYTMKPVRSTTGALRLEEVGAGPMLLVQIPAKSMLMDTARGRRIVDACVHEEQAKEASTDSNSLGMNLPGQVSTADTAPKK